MSLMSVDILVAPVVLEQTLVPVSGSVKKRGLNIWGLIWGSQILTHKKHNTTEFQK